MAFDYSYRAVSLLALTPVAFADGPHPSHFNHLDDMGTLRQLLPPSSVAAIVLLLSLAYGLQYRFKDALFTYFATASGVFLALLAVLSVIALHPAYASARTDARALQPFAGLLVATAWIVNVYLNSPALAGMPWPAVALGAPLAAVIISRWDRRAGGLAFAACVLAFYCWVLGASPIDVEAANMLPLIMAGSADFLAGQNPYLGQYPEIAGILHFHYLPALWLPYAAMLGAGLDPRLLNVALLVLIAVLWYRAAARRGRLPELGLYLAPLMVSPLITKMVVHGHIWPYWLLITVLTIMLVEGRLVLAAMLLGLLMASRQLAVFVAGPLGMYMLARLGLFRGAGHGAIALACFAVLMLPFALWTADFWQLTYLGLPDKGDAHVLAGNPLDQLSATGLLLHAGAGGFVRAVQALVFLALLLLAWRSGRSSTPPLLIVLGVGYLWTVSLNPFLYQYHYVPGLLLLIGGLTFAGLEASEPRLQRTTRPAPAPRIPVRE